MQILLKQYHFKIHWVEATLGFPFAITSFSTASWLAQTLLPWQGGNAALNPAMLPHPKESPPASAPVHTSCRVSGTTRTVQQDGALLPHFSLFRQTSLQKAISGDEKALPGMKIFFLTLNSGPSPTYNCLWLNSQLHYKKLSCFPCSDNWDSLLWFLNTQTSLCFKVSHLAQKQYQMRNIGFV